mmetsp:Transcript_13254/g.36604  ORF Transcript_13254/g.36604 Transcript_13254/m.36604 type:complete len:496 (-) Transcript_13254:89-1576(-)
MMFQSSKTLLCLAVLSFVAGSSSAETTTVHRAELLSISSQRGSHSDQDFSVLNTVDQTGSQNDWDTYVEFTGQGNRQRYKGTFQYQVPADMNLDDVTTLSLNINYLGDAMASTKWDWLIRNWNTRRWETIGDNRGVSSWTWSALQFDIDTDGGNLGQHYVSSSGRISVRLQTRNGDSGDDPNVVCDLDQMALHLKVETARTTTTATTTTPTTTTTATTTTPTTTTTTPTTTTTTTTATTPSTEPSWWKPPPGTTWQWQISSPPAIDTSLDVDMYDIDLFDATQQTIDQLHNDGRIVICYFSAGSLEDWRPDRDDFDVSLMGNPLDPQWPGEWWLDISQIDDDTSALARIMRARLDLAVSKNCDGVEPDNIDGYTNDNGLGLTAEHQRVYNTWLAAEAHRRSLSIGLKNDLDQVSELVSHFDWALNEQCWQYNECDRLDPFVNAGKAVFGVEYVEERDNGSNKPEVYCPVLNAKRFSWLEMTYDLDSTVVTDCRDI